MKEKISKFFERRRHIRREVTSLDQVPKQSGSSDPLTTLSSGGLAAIFSREDIGQDWATIAPELEHVCRIEDGTTGGVNPGDRRAVWYLIRGLNVRSVLEIGTHVGASTVHIASALKGVRTKDSEIDRSLVTVDVCDVNSDVSGWWKQYGLSSSPRDMIRAMNCDDVVTFVTENSLTFLDRCEDKFDFVFLDGDHSAATVYQELPRALKVLSQNGVILLHDYFPNNRPLWSNGSLIAGPYLGTTRLRSEGVAIKIIPLGALPWPTKLGSTVTSLAVVTRDLSGAGS